MTDTTVNKYWHRIVGNATTMTIYDIFKAGFGFGREYERDNIKAIAAQADLSGVGAILDKFEQRLIDGGLLRKPVKVPDNLSALSDRQISNVMHGRDPDDNGEFTASSMGAAQDAECSIMGDNDGPWEAKPDILGPLIVTRGDGVPLPDQAAAVEAFKAQCLRKAPPGAKPISSEAQSAIKADKIAAIIQYAGSLNVTTLDLFRALASILKPGDHE